MTIRDQVYTIIAGVAQEQNRTIAALDDDMVFMNSGLDSLCFAIIVARLEDAVGVDPFTTTEDIVFPTTLGEFVALYEHSAH